MLTFQLHQENRKKGKKRGKSVDEDDEEVKRDKLKKVCHINTSVDQTLKFFKVKQVKVYVALVIYVIVSFTV